MTQMLNKRKRYIFKVQSKPGDMVFLAGSFNNWHTKSRFMKDIHDDGNFQCVLLLKPGQYEYKFVINNNWTVDPNNQKFLLNHVGTLNSLINIEIEDKQLVLA